MARRGRPPKNRTVTFDDQTGEVTQNEEVMSLEEHDPPEDENVQASLPDIETPIPLFENMDLPDNLTPGYVRIWKYEKGTPAFKGQLPLSADEAQIGAQFGNGKFDVHLCNVAGRIMKRRLGIDISIDDYESEQTKSAAPSNGADTFFMRDFIKEERESRANMYANERATLREHHMSEQKRSDAFLSMLRASYETEAERSRDFYGAQSKAVGDTFAQMMMMQDRSHQQTMQLMMMQMQMQQLQSSQLLNVFKEGMGAGSDETPEEDGTQKLIAQGLDLMGKLPDLARVKMLTDVAKVKATKAIPARVAARAPAPSLSMPPMPTSASLSSNPPALPKIDGLTEEEIVEVLRLKKLTGENFTTLAKAARAQLEEGSEAPTEDPGDTEDDEDFFEDEEGDDHEDDFEDDEETAANVESVSNGTTPVNPVQDQKHPRARRPSA